MARQLMPLNEEDKTPLFGDENEITVLTDEKESSVDVYGKYKMAVPKYQINGDVASFVKFLSNFAALHRIIQFSESNYGYQRARRIYIGDVLMGYAYRGEFILRDLTTGEKHPPYVVFSTHQMYRKLADAKREIELRTQGQWGYDRRNKENREALLG